MPEKPLNTDDFGDFLKQFIDALDIKNPILIGHSNGGRTIINAVGRGIITAKKIVLIDSAGLKPKRSLGFKIKDDSKDFKDEIQPRFVFQLDLRGKSKDTIFSEFQSKTRYNVRLASKKGVEIKEGNKEDLKDFHRIMVETGKRDNFLIRSLSYFEKMYDNLYPNHMKLMMAYHEGKPISGIIDIIYGNKVWYLYGASSNEHRNLMPNYLLQWEMIKMAIARRMHFQLNISVKIPVESYSSIFRREILATAAPAAAIRAVEAGRRA